MLCPRPGSKKHSPIQGFGSMSFNEGNFLDEVQRKRGWRVSQRREMGSGSRTQCPGWGHWAVRTTTEFPLSTGRKCTYIEEPEDLGEVLYCGKMEYVRPEELSLVPFHIGNSVFDPIPSLLLHDTAGMYTRPVFASTRPGAKNVMSHIQILHKTFPRLAVALMSLETEFFKYIIDSWCFWVLLLWESSWNFTVEHVTFRITWIHLGSPWSLIFSSE